MPRLSLYKPERGQDYKFIDRQISEMFQAGGTDVYLHKYLGPKNAETGTAISLYILRKVLLTYRTCYS